MESKPYHRKLFPYIVEELGQRIVQGRYQTPTVLPTEDQLCEELSVSRGVLREATKVSMVFPEKIPKPPIAHPCKYSTTSGDTSPETEAFTTTPRIVGSVLILFLR